MIDEFLQNFLDNLIDGLPLGRLAFFGVLVILYVTRGYWLAPILLYNGGPLPPSKVELATPEQSIPEAARRQLAELAAGLSTLGFVPTAIIREHNGTPKIMYHQIHRHPGTGDVAGVGVVMAGADATPRGTSLAFTARLADGTDVKTLTDTVGLRSAPRERGRRVMLWMGDAVRYAATPEDTVRVYRIHRALVRRSKSTQRPITADDPVSFQLRVAADFRRRMTESGWYRDIGQGTLRVTAIGACLSMWRQAFPWRGMRRAAERRRVNQLLAEAERVPESGSLAA